MTKIDPRLRVLYLASVALGVFLFKSIVAIAILVAAQAALWLIVGIGARRLGRQVFKLWGFAAFVVASYALTAEDPAIDRWTALDVWKIHLPINVGGALLGVVMVLRVLCVVMASQVARAGDSRAIAAGLGKLHVPAIIAASIDAVLALLGDAERHGRGRGGGRGGGGGGGGGGGEEQEGFWASVKRLSRGDVGAIARRIERQIDRAEQHVASQGVSYKGRLVVRDVAVIAGLSLTMLGIKALKILPSIPFAPGHKLVILTPIYIVASLKTKSRFGATLTGLTMGSVAFLMGDGRYGIFEIVKHVAPGVVCDLLVPLMTRGGSKNPGGVAWSLLGGLIGACRFATIFVVTLTVQAPAVAYAILVPGLVIHTTFGILSGYVTHQLVKATWKVDGHDNVTSEKGSEPSQQPSAQDGHNAGAVDAPLSHEVK